MVGGTKVLEIGKGANSKALFTKAELCNLLGISTTTFNAVYLSANVSNGDGSAFPAHLECATYSNDALYIVFKDILTGTMKCRVNYVLFYFN